MGVQVQLQVQDKTKVDFSHVSLSLYFPSGAQAIATAGAAGAQASRSFLDDADGIARGMREKTRADLERLRSQACALVHTPE